MIQTSDYKKYLDCTNYLREHIDTYIEAFVKYYGENRRKEIEEKFKNTLIIAYQRPTNIKLLIAKAKESKTKELMDRMMEKNTWNIPRELLFDKQDSFQYKEIMPIDNYSLFLNAYQSKKCKTKEELLDNNYHLCKKIIPELTQEEFMEMITKKETLPKYDNISPNKMRHIIALLDIDNIDKLYQRTSNRALQLLQKINPNITLENLEEFMEKDEKIQGLNYLTELYNLSLEEFDQYSSEFKQQEEELSSLAAKDSSLKEKLYHQLIIENIDLIPPDKREGLELFKEDSSKYYYLSREIRDILGHSILCPGVIDAFSEENEKILNNPNSAGWKINSIKEDRIKYFQKIGIDLGTNYDDYCNHEEVKRNWPSRESVQKYVECRKKLENEYNNEYFLQSDFNKRTRKEIEERNFLDKVDPFDANLYLSSNNTFVSHNVRRKDNGYESSCFIIINMDTYDDNYRDHFIVHELNHLLETSLENANDSFYTTTCGWEILDSVVATSKEEKINTIERNDKKREYELFNEIINELIAQDISKVMKENHMVVFDQPEEAKYKWGTSYEQTMFLVKEFFEEFKEEILKSRSNGNIDIIIDAVGKENFDELNQLFSIFHKHYGGMKIYSILDDIKEKRVTDQSKVYFELVDRKNEILERMRAKKQEKSQEISI